MPSATATAPPEVEPPGTRERSAGFRGVPKCGLSPIPENANSLMFVLATMTAPRSKPLDDWRVVRSRPAVARPGRRTGVRHFAGDVKQILDGDDCSVQWPHR